MRAEYVKFLRSPVDKFYTAMHTWRPFKKSSEKINQDLQILRSFRTFRRKTSCFMRLSCVLFVSWITINVTIFKAHTNLMKASKTQRTSHPPKSRLFCLKAKCFLTGRPLLSDCKDKVMQLLQIDFAHAFTMILKTKYIGGDLIKLDKIGYNKMRYNNADFALHSWLEVWSYKVNCQNLKNGESI